MGTQDDKAAAWLREHGIGSASSNASASMPTLPQLGGGGESDWASDAERWYAQRAQGVDVAQLLPYHRTARQTATK